MPFTAWKHIERNRQRDRKKYVMISGGFVIPAVQNNSLNDIAFFRAYLTPPRTPRISGLKSQILKPTFLS